MMGRCWILFATLGMKGDRFLKGPSQKSTRPQLLGDLCGHLTQSGAIFMMALYHD